MGSRGDDALLRLLETGGDYTEHCVISYNIKVMYLLDSHRLIT